MDVLSVVLDLVLAVGLAASAAMKLSHRSQVVEMYARVGVAERLLNPLAVILLAAVTGLVVGQWWEPLAIAALIGVVLYFLLAVGAHIRTRALANLAIPVVHVLLAAAALAIHLV